MLDPVVFWASSDSLPAVRHTSTSLVPEAERYAVLLGSPLLPLFDVDYLNATLPELVHGGLPALLASEQRRFERHFGPAPRLPFCGAPSDMRQLEFFLSWLPIPLRQSPDITDFLRAAASVLARVPDLRAPLFTQDDLDWISREGSELLRAVTGASAVFGRAALRFYVNERLSTECPGFICDLDVAVKVLSPREDRLLHGVSRFIPSEEFQVSAVEAVMRLVEVVPDSRLARVQLLGSDTEFWAVIRENYLGRWVIYRRIGLLESGWPAEKDRRRRQEAYPEKTAAAETQPGPDSSPPFTPSPK